MLRLIAMLMGLAFAENVLAECGYVKDSDEKSKYVCTDASKLPRYHPPKRGLNFHGYPCTVDCSGHKAGYDWAKRKGITDPSQCTGKSRSFIEGCWAAASERR
jgi:hypothetical protein